MRWDALFADLAGEAEAEAEAERQSDVADRIRVELGRLRLIDRLSPLLAAGSGRLRIGVTGHSALAGSLQALGIDWLLLAQDDGRVAEVLVPLAAVQWLQGLGPASVEPGWEGNVGAGLTIRLALRRIVRDRSRVSVALTSGDVLSGRLSRVGADHLEMSSATPGDSPGANNYAIPIGALAFVARN
jgi:hypothetical protein